MGDAYGFTCGVIRVAIIAAALTLAARAMAPGGGSGLTAAQRQQATRAARDIRWGERAIRRWDRLYRRATNAVPPNGTEAENITKIIEGIQQVVD